MNIHKQLVLKLAGLKVKNSNRLNKVKRQFANKHKIGMISNAELLYLYRQMLKKKALPHNEDLEKLLQKSCKEDNKNLPFP